MPFTPFHMGPGLAIKAVSGRHFSLMVFGFSQVAIDIEPLVRITRGDALLHGPTHTYVGASLIAPVSVIVGRPVCQFFLNHWSPDRSSAFWTWLRGPKLISWPAAIAGAFAGVFVEGKRVTRWWKLRRCAPDIDPSLVGVAAARRDASFTLRNSGNCSFLLGRAS